MFVLAVTASSRDLNPSIILDQTDRLSHLHGNSTSSLMYRILSIPPRAGGNHAMAPLLPRRGAPPIDAALVDIAWTSAPVLSGRDCRGPEDFA